MGLPDTNSAKNAILGAIRAINIPPAPLPPLQRSEWITYPDPAAQFAIVLASIGGTCETVADTAELNEKLRHLPAFTTARQIVNLVPHVNLPAEHLLKEQEIADPHHLVDVDLAIMPGEFAVAENGAVWCVTRHLRHRVLYFITQHLALVVPREQIVHNMHQAYERLAWGQAEFGLFLAGPSKTADIEQSLVIGAHGARSLTVFLV
ncbi:MAG: LUD domain-containing protein [Pirellulales bacterium]|nr:LUD domain-containing protein [Pirellulales bacterium]